MKLIHPHIVGVFLPALKLSIIALAAGLLAGCQTAHVTSATGRVTADRTTPIVVKEFDASKATFQGEKSDISVLADADRRRISQIIAAATIQRLTNNGYLARPYSADAPANALVVAGTVTAVDKGSFSKRLLIGAGSGAASIKASVTMYNAATPNTPMANVELAGTSKAFTGGMYSNDDWIGIYSSSLGFKIADYIMGKVK